VRANAHRRGHVLSADFFQKNIGFDVQLESVRLKVSVSLDYCLQYTPKQRDSLKSLRLPIVLPCPANCPLFPLSPHPAYIHARGQNAPTTALTARSPYDRRPFFPALLPRLFASSVFEPSGELLRPAAAARPTLVCRGHTHRYQRCVPGKFSMVLISKLFADYWQLAG
jgi:hypothetical protein